MILKIPEYFDDVERLFVIVIKNALFKKIGSPPLYSLLPLWAGDAKEVKNIIKKILFTQTEDYKHFADVTKMEQVALL